MLNEKKIARDFEWRLRMMDQSTFTDADVVAAIRYAIPDINGMLINYGSWHEYRLNIRYTNANGDPICHEIYKSLDIVYSNNDGEPLYDDDVIEAVSGSRFGFITDIVEWDSNKRRWFFKGTDIDHDDDYPDITNPEREHLMKSGFPKLLQLGTEGTIYTTTRYPINIRVPCPNEITSKIIKGMEKTVKDMDDIALRFGYWPTWKGETTMKLPTATKIWFNPPYTTVLFDDGTKTTARAEDGYVFSKYSGFMACMMKKIYGSTKNCIDMLNKAEDKALKDSPKYKRERERKGNKMARAAKREMDRRLREQRINDIISCMKDEREAEKRMAKEEE